MGTPVVRDIPVARRLFKKAQLYSFIPLDEIEPIIRIFEWLQEVETTYLEDIGQKPEETEQAEQAPEAPPATAEKTKNGEAEQDPPTPPSS